MSRAEFLQGDVRATLATLPANHFHCAVTSPPYWNLRSYLKPDDPNKPFEIGSEPTPQAYVETMVGVFRELRRVLRDDGTFWLNIGDSYAGSWGAQSRGDYTDGTLEGSCKSSYQFECMPKTIGTGSLKNTPGLKPKDLVGVPWRLALALQADGWYLRDAVIWAKPCPMPSSQRDRCTSAYEFIFQLTKSEEYFFDYFNAKQPASEATKSRMAQDVENQHGSERANGGTKTNGTMKAVGAADSATMRNVWRIPPGDKWSGDHYATYPVELPATCLRLSTSEKGCCPDCGAPWERILSDEAIKRDRSTPYTDRQLDADAVRANTTANDVAGSAVKHLGWRPGCPCGPVEQDSLDWIPKAPSPCRVLDPFNGVGTTAVACRRMGLDYTGCELNPQWIEDSKARLNAEANRGAKMTKHKPAAGQAELFA